MCFFPQLRYCCTLSASQGKSAQQTAGVIVAGASVIQPTLVKIALKQLGMGGTQMWSSDQGPQQACNLTDGTEPLHLHCCCLSGMGGYLSQHGFIGMLCRCACRPWRLENQEQCGKERSEPLVPVDLLKFQVCLFGCKKKQSVLNLDVPGSRQERVVFHVCPRKGPV